MKTCNACHVEKPLSEFSSNKTTKDGLMYQCRECNNARVTAYFIEHPVQEREWYKNVRYTNKGITKAQFELAAQNGCAVCGRQDEKMVIDHDHSCCPGRRSCGKCFRGVLCQRCNRGLGHFFDDIQLLENAKQYLALTSGKK